MSKRSVYSNRGSRWVPYLQPLEDRTLLSAGGLDLTFNGTGKQTVAFDIGDFKSDQAHSMAVQPDGKVVMAGAARVGPGNYDFAVARLNSDGTPDMGFGTSGKRTFTAFNLTEVASGVVLQPDGKIVVAGFAEFSGNFDFVVARLNANGSTDNGFGLGGLRTIAFDVGGGKFDRLSGVALQPDGKIVVVGMIEVGSGSYDFGVARLNADGSLDPGFGAGGKSTFGFSDGDYSNGDQATAIAVQPDGKIVVAGSTQFAGSLDFVVARLNPSGAPDTLFGSGGHRIIPFNLGNIKYDKLEAMALQPDGNIVLAGNVLDISDRYFGVARLNAKGTLDIGFGSGGKSYFDVGDREWLSAVAVQADGKIVMAGQAEVTMGNSDFLVARANPNGHLDTSFGSGVHRTIAFDLGGAYDSDFATGIAVQADGKIVVAGSAEGPSLNYDFAVARLDGANVHFLAVGGAPNQLQVFSRGGASLGTFSPFAGYEGGVAVAFGDVNSDGIDDLIVSATIGNPAVKVYSGAKLSDGTFFINPESNLLAHGFAYGINFNVGVNIAAGDVNGDGFADIITGAVPGNPHVKVFDGKSIFTSGVVPTSDDPSLLAQGFVYGLGFNVGANVGAGDVNGDGLADVITGASAGNPHTRVFNAKAILASRTLPTGNDTSVLAEFFPYGLNFNVGSFVAVADYNRDGFKDVITGASVGNPEVRVFSGKDMAKGTFDPSGSLLDFFMAFEVGQNIGVSVGASDFTGDGKAEVLVGTRAGTPRHRLFQNNLPGPATFLPGFDVIDGAFSGGLWVAA